MYDHFHLSESKENASIYLCTRYLIDHLPFLELELKEVADNFQKDFPYPLVSPYLIEKDPEQQTFGAFRLAVDHLFYHECLQEKFDNLRPNITDEMSVSCHFGCNKLVINCAF
jgi:hypothetical protein